MTDRVGYVGLGIWPYFVGFTFSEEALARELKRLNVGRDIPWIKDGSDACAHHFNKGNDRMSIICVRAPSKRHSKEQFAAMVAHEAMHVVQEMRDALGDLGPEAEAYTLQSIVQDVLQFAWATGKLRRVKPVPF